MHSTSPELLPEGEIHPPCSTQAEIAQLLQAADSVVGGKVVAVCAEICLRLRAPRVALQLFKDQDWTHRCCRMSASSTTKSCRSSKQIFWKAAGARWARKDTLTGG